MAACSFIGDMLFGPISIGYILMKAIFIFAFIYVGIYVAALIINELTSSFSSKKDINIVYKLVVYSCTGFFAVASVTLLFPPLVVLIILSFYSFYLFWEGCTNLLGTPEDNKVGFVVVSSLMLLSIYAILYFFLLRSILVATFNVNLAIG
jgi:hypothetical protein